MAASKAPTRTQAKDFLATFGELATKWLAEHSAIRLSSHDDNVNRLNHDLLPVFGKVAATDITGGMVSAFTAKLVNSQRLAPATTNRILALLRAILRQGAKTRGTETRLKLGDLPDIPLPTHYVADAQTATVKVAQFVRVELRLRCLFRLPTLALNTAAIKRRNQAQEGVCHE